MANTSTHISGSDAEYDVVEGLSTWEFINPSDDEYDAVFAFTDTEDDDVSDDLSDVIASPPISRSLNYLMALNVQIVDTKLNSIDVDKKGFQLNYQHQEAEEEEEEKSGNCDYEDEVDEEEEEEEDLDDELVPMSVRGKFGKERIKKLGKRVGPRMNKSKKLAYIYNRPGCVRGLGVQHSYI